METRNILVKKSFFIIRIRNYYKETFTEVVVSHKENFLKFLLILNHHVSLKKKIISEYSNHPSIQKIKSVFDTDSKFYLPRLTACL